MTHRVSDSASHGAAFSEQACDRASLRKASRGSPLRRILALAGASLALGMLPIGAQAEITQDCILEGTVDMRKAEELGQPVYVKFRSARRGSEAGCTMNRRSKSRRVRFISSPSTEDIEIDDISHGSKVRYRYIERDNQPGTWELIEIS